MPIASRVAILADIHGNLAALEAALADAASQQPDLYIFAGDLVMNAPEPAATLARIRRMRAPAVIGNTDLDVLENLDPVGRWARRQLDTDALAYIQALPLECRITPSHGQSPGDDLLVVHATPRNCYDVLLTSLGSGTSFTRTTPEAEAIAMLNDAQANLIVYGHIHYASAGTIGGQRVASVGAVGFPLDRDHRAAYAIAQWDGAGWALEHRRVAYDYEAVAQALERSGHPFGARQAAILRTAAWVPRPDTE